MRYLLFGIILLSLISCKQQKTDLSDQSDFPTTIDTALVGKWTGSAMNMVFDVNTDSAIIQNLNKETMASKAGIETYYIYFNDDATFIYELIGIQPELYQVDTSHWWVSEEVLFVTHKREGKELTIEYDYELSGDNCILKCLDDLDNDGDLDDFMTMELFK